MHLIGHVLGLRFTRRCTLALHIDQSQLDRVYFSDGGWWPHRILEMQHIPDQTLSDHDPISISFIMENRITLASSIKKSSYFKANAYILESEDNITALKAAWLGDRTPLTNPQANFHLAYARLRAKYILLHAKPRYSHKTKRSCKRVLGLLKRIWKMKKPLRFSRTGDKLLIV